MTFQLTLVHLCSHPLPPDLPFIRPHLQPMITKTNQSIMIPSTGAPSTLESPIQQSIIKAPGRLQKVGLPLITPSKPPGQHCGQNLEHSNLFQCEIGDTFNGKRSKDHLHNGLANPPPNSSIVGKLTKVPEVFVSKERD